MPLMQSLLPELDHEAASTRRILERVPMERADWRPHPKSFSLGELANHLTTLISWAPYTMSSTELDFSTSSFEPPVRTTTEALLADFDAYVAAARAALDAADDEAALTAWTLRSGEQVHFTMPRIAVVRSMVMNHLIHHRAQLGVYLRLLDVPVPGMYGPSADDAA